MRRAEQVIAMGLRFVWLGLVFGISVIETPLKFMAPGTTTPLGLGLYRARRREADRAACPRRVTCPAVAPVSAATAIEGAS
jgi:hypothetical protein